jgi:hypothetical protein
MKKFASLVISAFLLSYALSNTTTSFANDVPLTIDGVINCAHPDNAITTTCRGEAPPPPVAPIPSGNDLVPTSASVPITVAPEPGGTVTHSGSTSINCALESSKGSPFCVPMTIDGVINCAHPDNAITTTCWDLAQAAKKAGANPVPSQVDCSLEIYKNYPVCTNVAPQSVIDYEAAKANAVTLPDPVNCADPMLMQTGACTNRTTTDLPADCVLSENANLPRCQPMTLADGSINCAQPDNAITTTCWEQSAALKSFGATTAINCSLPGYSAYPVCTGVKPLAVLEYEKSSNIILPMIDTATPVIKVETITAVAPISEEIREEVQVTGSVNLKTRTTKATVLTLDVNAPKSKVQVVATKKGSKTLTQTVVMDADGNRSVKFNKNLKGFTIKIIVDGQTLDTIKVK